MSYSDTKVATWSEIITYTQESFIELPEFQSIRAIHEGKIRSKMFLTVYPMFIGITSILALFFAVSLIATSMTQYFLDWASSLVGFIGTFGLVFVGWFSRRQIREE